jgi:hypothetical protein
VSALFRSIALAGLISSFNKRVVFINAPFALQSYGSLWRSTARPLAFALQKLPSGLCGTNLSSAIVGVVVPGRTVRFWAEARCLFESSGLGATTPRTLALAR